MIMLFYRPNNRAMLAADVRLLDSTSIWSLAIRLAVVLSCLSVPARCSADEAVAVNRDYLLQKWEVDDGLPDNNITAITQTREGYLWIGTSRGLVRFDGTRFSLFNNINTTALAAGAIRCLSEDAEGALWIGDEQGRVLRHQAGRFSLMRPAPASAMLTSLACDATGAIWTGFSNFHAERWQNGRWTELGAGNGLVGSNSFRCVSNAAGRIWFTTETSYGYFDGQRFVALAADAPFPQLTPRRAGGYWLARGNMLQLFIENQQASYGATMPWQGGCAEVQELCADQQGALWIGTKGQGLFRFTDGEFTRVPTSHNFITAIHEDREGNIWVGTGGGGLNRLRLRGLQIHDARSGLPTDVIYSVCQEGENALWFGLRKAGAVRLVEDQPTVFSSTNGWPGGVLSTLCADRQGGVWFGTFVEGLIHWKDGQFERKGLKGEHIESLFQDRHGILWIGTAHAGLLQLRDGKVTRFPTEDGLKEITAITEDSAGALWIGTQQGTLHQYDGLQFRRFDRAEGMPGSAIQTILADGPETLWAGTRGDGLVRIHQGKVQRITSREGLPDDDIRQILPDDAGNLWFGSLHGLFRASRHDLQEVAAGQREMLRSVTYGRNDGLGNFEFIEGYFNAMCRTRNGKLWFATLRGAIEVDPRELVVRSAPPPVCIEELFVDGHARPLPVSGRLEIAPLSSKIEIRYTAPCLTAPDKVRFRYRLQHDKNWIDAGPDRVATFLSPPPGPYQFHVTACNSEGVWNPTGASLDFVVQPALWQTVWFRAAGVLGLVALGAVGVRIVTLRRMRQQLHQLEHENALEKERARIAQNMHDELGASLTRIALISEQTRHDPSVAPETAVRLEKLSRTAREVTQTLDEIVWTVNPGNDSLERLIGYLSEYATEYLSGAQIQLEQDLPESVPDIPISSDVRHNLLMAVKESLNNAVKHAAAGQIALRIGIESHRLVVEIKDNGKGFALDQSPGNGNGLGNLRQRLTTAGGDCRIESAPGDGTRVILSLPLPENRSN